jgi:5-methylthioadenosine/S-adenosylhomocysteine deaminase
MFADDTILIRDALIVPDLAADVMPFWGWIAVEDGCIAGLGRGDPPKSRSGTVLAGRERAVLPGLVNAHAHSHSSLTRGSAEGLALDGWIAAIEREQGILDDEQAYWGALSTYAEALLSGTTAILDMALRPRAAMRAAQAIGIRAAIAPYAADSKPFAPTLAETEALLAPSSPRHRVQIWVGLHDLESSSDEQVLAGVGLASRYSTRLHCTAPRRASQWSGLARAPDALPSPNCKRSALSMHVPFWRTAFGSMRTTAPGLSLRAPMSSIAHMPI